MEKKLFKIIILLFISVLLIVVALVKAMDNYYGYLLLSALIIQGANAIIDFIQGQPMNVGVAKILYPTDRNKIGRVILLFLSISMIGFGCWWIITRPI